MVKLIIKKKVGYSRWCIRCNLCFISSTRAGKICMECDRGSLPAALTRGLSSKEFLDLKAKGNFFKYRSKKRNGWFKKKK